MSNVTVVKFGLGKVVSNWGKHGGVPAVFIEPVLGEAGQPGELVEGNREPQIVHDAVSDGGIIIEFHGGRGADVLIEDIQSALDNEHIPATAKAVKS